MSRKNVVITVGIVAIVAAVAASTLYFWREKPLTVTTETLKTCVLEAIVSASGKIHTHRLW